MQQQIRLWQKSVNELDVPRVKQLLETDPELMNYAKRNDLRYITQTLWLDTDQTEQQRHKKRLQLLDYMVVKNNVSIYTRRGVDKKRINIPIIISILDRMTNDRFAHRKKMYDLAFYILTLGNKEDNLQFLEQYITQVANEKSYDAISAFWRDFRYKTLLKLRNDYLQYIESLNKTLRKRYIQSRRKEQEQFQKQKDVSQLQKKRSKQKEILSSISLDPNVFQSVLHMKKDPYSLLTEYL